MSALGYPKMPVVDTTRLERQLRIARLSIERCAAPRPPRWPWLLALVCLALGFFAGKALADEPPLTLLVRPTIMLHRGDIRVEAHVARHVDNRLLAIAWTSDVGSAGETRRPLAGDDGPVLHELQLPSQPAAHYVFVATLFDARGKPRGHADAQIFVPEAGDDRRAAPRADR